MARSVWAEPGGESWKLIYYDSGLNEIPGSSELYFRGGKTQDPPFFNFCRWKHTAIRGMGGMQPKGQLAGRAPSLNKFSKVLVCRQRQIDAGQCVISKIHASPPPTVLQTLGEEKKQRRCWCLQLTESLPLLSLHSTRCFPRAKFCFEAPVTFCFT